MVPAMSSARTFTNWLWSAVSALLLVVVAAHAMEPLRADHQRVRGSAFSASTEEVSLKAATGSVVDRELVRLDRVLPPEPAAAVTVRRPVPASPILAVSGDAAAPAADFALHPISPRAPPLV